MATDASSPLPTAPIGRTATVLNRDLSDFVVEFSIAMHKHAMYPDGHPSLQGGLERVARRLDALLAERQSVALGVARDQLIIEGVATDGRSPLLGALARNLHRRDIGALKFYRGVRDEELGTLMRALSADVERTAGSEPGASAMVGAWAHVRVLPLTYDQLELVEEDVPDDAEPDERQEASQLWLDLALAALQADRSARTDTDPTKVAEAINTHVREEAYDQVIIGYLLKIAEQIRTTDRAEAALLQQRMSQLVQRLDREQLARLLELGGDAAQRNRFVRDAAQGMVADAALSLVLAAADASNHVISDSLLRLFGKLAMHAERGAPELRADAEAALREQIEELMEGWNLADPNTKSYGGILEQMSSDGPLFVVAQDQTQPVEPERVVQMSLEVGSVGPTALEAVDQLVARGEVGVLVKLLDEAPADSASAEALAEHVAVTTPIRGFVEEGRPDSEHLEWLLARQGARAIGPLLDILAESESRTARRRALELLGRLSSMFSRELGDEIVQRLPEAPWFLQRNLLLLLDRLPTWPVGLSIAPYLAHGDPRVRREAMRLSLGLSGQRDAAVIAGLRDEDEQVARLALVAAADGCPPEAAAAVVERVAHRALPAELELLAIRVLGSVGPPGALECLLGFVMARRALWRRVRVDPRSPASLAALAALLARWPDDPRVARVRSRARRHRDPAVRAAAGVEEAAA